MSESEGSINSPIKNLKVQVKQMEETIAKFTKRTDKLEGNKENIKPNNLNGSYNIKSNAYIAKLNKKDMLNPKPETMHHHTVVYGEESQL